MSLIWYFDVAVFFLFSVIWLTLILFLKKRHKKSGIFLFFFTLFYIYLFTVLHYTLFQFQSLLVLKLILSDLILRGLEAEEHINLIPLLMLSADDIQTSLLNILLFLPFGVGLPLITSFRMKQVIFTGSLLSIGIEALQFSTGYLAGMTFRIADINDVFFNTVGTAVGYIIFITFIKWLRPLFHGNAKNALIAYILRRPQVEYGK